MSTKSICVWSGPRNISTALMYSFAQRSDTTVVDEALYAHYLSKTDAAEYHPGAAEVLATMEHDGDVVIRDSILGAYETPIVFHKCMTHHLEQLDWSFMAHTVNAILIRDPVDMLPSYAVNVEMPSQRDVGYKANVILYNYLQSLGQDPPILDSRQVLMNPPKVLGELCKRLGIPFDEAMLSWQPGPRPEDGSWSKYWYHSVHKSIGFAPYRPKTTPFPDKLKPLLAESAPYYEQLAALAIQA